MKNLRKLLILGGISLLYSLVLFFVLSGNASIAEFHFLNFKLYYFIFPNLKDFLIGPLNLWRLLLIIIPPALNLYIILYSLIWLYSKKSDLIDDLCKIKFREILIFLSGAFILTILIVLIKLLFPAKIEPTRTCQDYYLGDLSNKNVNHFKISLPQGRSYSFVLGYPKGIPLSEMLKVDIEIKQHGKSIHKYVIQKDDLSTSNWLHLKNLTGYIISKQTNIDEKLEAKKIYDVFINVYQGPINNPTEPSLSVWLVLWQKLVEIDRHHNVLIEKNIQPVL